jgi:large conductance mechanosensitive channel
VKELFTDGAMQETGISQMANPVRLFQSSKGGPMLKEFKEFAMRGNVLDMAVGIIIGAAFGKIIGSFVEDILMPPIGMLLGKVDFSNLFLSLTGQSYPTLAAAKAAGAATLNYGVFFNHVFNFLIVAFAIFLLIKQVNRLKREEAAPPVAPTTKDCPYCLSVVPIKATRCAHCTAELKAA